MINRILYFLRLKKRPYQGLYPDYETRPPKLTHKLHKEVPHYCRSCFHCKPEWGNICYFWESDNYSSERKPKDMGCHCWFPRQEKNK